MEGRDEEKGAAGDAAGGLGGGGGGNTPGELTYHAKGIIMRSIFGQLRWYTEEGNVECPFSKIRPVAPHLQIIGEYACEALLAELITCKISEYVCRVEQVWRDLGSPQFVPPVKTSVASAMSGHAGLGGAHEVLQDQAVAAVPHLSNNGMLSYMGGRFSNPDFGHSLNLDMRKLVGIQQPKVFFYDIGKRK
jgi:hypothetical protein